MSQNRLGLHMVAVSALLAAAWPVALWAQESAQPAAPRPAQASSAQAASSQARSSSAKPVNIQLAILLTDKADGKTVAEEAINFLLADRQLGRLRRHLPSNVPNKNLAVDATPEIVGSRLRVSLTLNYNAANLENASGQTQGMIFVKTITAFVDVGKPTTVLETTGETANRRLTLQVTATIPK